MKRLTVEHWQNLDPWECCGQDNYCMRPNNKPGGCRNGCIVPKLYTRLAQYEDTGLSPMGMHPGRILQVLRGDREYRKRYRRAVCWAKYVKYGEVADIPYAVEVLESLRNCIYEQAEEIPLDCLYVAW